MRHIRRVIVHHSASPRETTKATDIARWHKEKGWYNIGYHYVIESDGKIVRGRQIDQAGAHCSADGANHDSIGVCLVGNNTVKGEEWSPAQRSAFTWLRFAIRETLVQPDLLVLGHRDVPGAATLCPGLNVQTELLGDSIA